MHRHEEEREQPSPARSTSSLTARQGMNEAIVHQVLETARQQSETARKQTELLEFVLRHSPRSSAQSSKRSSRHQSPVRQLYDRLCELPISHRAPHDSQTEEDQRVTAEVTQRFEDMNIHMQQWPTPPAVSRVTQLPNHALDLNHGLQANSPLKQYSHVVRDAHTGET